MIARFIRRLFRRAPRNGRWSTAQAERLAVHMANAKPRSAMHD